MSKTTHIDRDGNLSVNGTFNFEGKLKDLKKIIEETIKEHGEDTECKLNTFGSFPHRWSSHIILKKEIK
jgi:hypothetical protein